MSGKYEIGFGKPPKETQFQKGQSGNPKGRPSGTKNLRTDLFEELRENVLVREGATEKSLSKQRAILKSLTVKAIKGDTRAVAIVLNLVQRFLDPQDDDGAEIPLTDDEQSILKTLEKRFEGRLKPKPASRKSETAPDRNGEPDGTH